MKEIWKDIPGYEGLYKVSNLARIKSENHTARFVSKKGNEAVRAVKGHILSQTINPRDGRVTVMLTNNNSHRRVFVHRIVATAFVDNPRPGVFTEVNHIDENPLNNSPENLEWCTRWYNMHYGTLPQKVADSGKSRRKPVRAVEANTTYHSLSDAQKDGYDPSGIRHSIKEHKTYKGIHWEFI